MAQTKVTKNEIETQENWITPSYTAGWSDYDATEWFGIRYMKDSLGFVHMKGLIKNISGATKNGGETLFTLPVGYRPIHRIRTIAPGYNGIFQLDIMPSGAVLCMSPIIATEWCSLAAVVFKAEQ